MIKRYMHLYDASSDSPEEISRFVDERFAGFVITGFTYNFGDNGEYSVQFAPKNEKEIFGERWAEMLESAYGTGGGTTQYEEANEALHSPRPSSDLILGAGGDPYNETLYNSATEWEASGDVAAFVEQYVSLTYSSDIQFMVTQGQNFSVGGGYDAPFYLFVSGNRTYLDPTALSGIKKRESKFYTPYLSVIKNNGNPDTNHLLWNPKAVYDRPILDYSKRYHVTYRVLSWDTSSTYNAELVSTNINPDEFPNEYEKAYPCDFTLISPEGNSDTSEAIVFLGEEGPTVSLSRALILNPDTGCPANVSTSFGKSLIFSRYYESSAQNIMVYPTIVDEIK